MGYFTQLTKEFVSEFVLQIQTLEIKIILSLLLNLYLDKIKVDKIKVIKG